ncbi:MAG: DNA gyrase inhibitor YacG [Phycisphaeraceae bacterium]
MNNTNSTTAKNTIPCPICRKSISSDSEHAPFCSARCKTIDLGRWADESYKITRPIEHRDLEEGVD